MATPAGQDPSPAFGPGQEIVVEVVGGDLVESVREKPVRDDYLSVILLWLAYFGKTVPRVELPSGTGAAAAPQWADAAGGRRRRGCLLGEHG